ncbi:hypothetical protein chiPu_0008559 [Chiloscyllium punctatum]|uniref:Uncharacterized protein n=1 Tax=Chiloscyllium punctatum TaxID=137246 RepID=A0A401SIE0_CHIPU|nr:hypothetical protein [Chiloscyllium punctatum]
MEEEHHGNCSPRGCTSELQYPARPACHVTTTATLRGFQRCVGESPSRRGKDTAHGSLTCPLKSKKNACH